MIDLGDENNIQTEIESLRKNLLDMSLRNNLLNFKPKKRSIEIIDEDIPSLYDLIVTKKANMRFYSNEHLDDEYSKHESWDENLSIKDSHLDKNLQTNYDKDTLKNKLIHLYRENKTSIEEQGYNNLFLALGFLEWTDIGHSEKINKSPLVLIPINIERKSISSQFTVNWTEDDVRCNLSLIYKLKEQSIEIPEYELETKEDLIEYFNTIKTQIAFNPDWKINDDIYISNFSFKKFIMFKDLDPANWNSFESNPVNQLFTGENYDYEYGDYKEITPNNYYKNNYNVLDADSSQLAVLNEMKKGKNLVVEGPPGTGKSQTIVNLIAQLIADDKKILFVSEKKAALDVVKTRLDTIGLGEGCLELHGKGYNKREFLDEIRNTLDKDSIVLNDKNQFKRLGNTNFELNSYVNTLHNIYGETELTSYKIIGMYIYRKGILLKYNQELLDLELPNVSILNNKKRANIIAQINEIQQYYDIISPISDNIWKNTSFKSLTSFETKNIASNLVLLDEDINRFGELNQEISQKIGTPLLQTFDLSNLKNNAKFIKPNIKLLTVDLNLEDYIDDIDTFQKSTRDINIEIFDLDLNEIKKDVNRVFGKIDSLNLNLELIEKEDFNTILSDFKLNKDFIEKSEIKNILNYPNLEADFREFKSKKDSFFKRLFDGNFKEIRNKFKTYYSSDVDDDQIEMDIEELINSNNKLNDLRNKILTYSGSNIDNDDKIVNEFEKLIDYSKELDSIENKLYKYCVDVNSTNIKNKIDDLIKTQELLEQIKNKEQIGKKYFNKDWKSYKSDINVLNEKLRMLEGFKQIYDSGFFTDNTIKFIEEDDFEFLDVKLDEMEVVKNNIETIYNELDEKLHFINEFRIETFNGTNINDFKEKMSRLKENTESLNDYRLFNKYCIEYEDKYTSKLIEYIKEDKINSELFVHLFYYNFANTALNDILENVCILDEFKYEIHEQKLSDFKELDKNIFELNRMRVLEKLGKKRPNILVSPSPNSDLGILRKEMSKKTKIKPIRRILSETKDVISLIKPCFMMSPISIAQYLPPEIFESYFDYVIFDEASQLKIEDAIGPMLRGKKYIVMGDTKQLPPTTFFEKELDIDEDEDEENFTDNIESILHICKNSFETKMLKWHYRSRHESLITVSNSEFYNNGLYVFPSPIKESEDLGLKFKYNPNTVYQRGTGSNNIKEAEEVIDYAFQCFEKYGDSKSLGIGTFNIKQKNTLLDILEKKLETKPDFEKFFKGEGENGFFIKNLENIQGDERDIILISTGYGKDENHKLTLNFGPLNKEGGERRLNVLITRAREQCVVFSNFKSSDMHITENSKRGVIALKKFLYYAEEKKLPVNERTGKDFDSEFEESVYNFLTDEGYIVEKQVGCANYRIDLAIVDKDDADRYILGIECDGASYHSSRFARDRDRLRQEVLEGLGWKFHRIWSTDWLHSPKRAKSRLIESIEDAIENKNNIKMIKKEESEFKPEVIVKSNEEKQNEEFSNYFAEYEKFHRTNEISRMDIYYNLIKKEAPIHIEDIYDYMKKIDLRKLTKKYKESINVEVYSLTGYKPIYEKEDFYYIKNIDYSAMKVRKRIKPNMDRICPEEIENSIIYTLKIQFSSHEDDLIKTASKHLGFKTTTAKVKERYTQIINSMIYSHKIIKDNKIIKLVS